MIPALILAAVLQGPPCPEPRDCRDCMDAVAEARRVRRNVLVRGTVMLSAHMGNVSVTAWAKHRAACSHQAPPCIVEENQAFPLTAGLFAGKLIYVGGGTIAEYELDKRGHRVWARVLTFVVTLAGVVPAFADMRSGLRVKGAR